MLEKIYEEIKKAKTIVIARHIGMDPDALGSQFALKVSIEKTFPEKNVYAVGAKSAKYHYFPKLDKFDQPKQGVLLVVVDTPDKRRVDIENIEGYQDICKIDHHPFIEKFGDCEFIDTKASSASELVYRFLKENDMVINQEVAKYIFLGMVADTNRFLFNTTDVTFDIARELVKDYELDTTSLYQKLYMRPMCEVKFQGYIAENMKITEHGLGYVILPNDVVTKYGVDVSSAGNMVNNFNNIEELIAWVAVTQDIKNDQWKFNIRSRGPIVNHVAEKYNGGGHVYACGARTKTLDEAMQLIKDLDQVCQEYQDRGIEGEKNEL